MREYLRGEIAEQEATLARLEARLRELLVPKDPNDGRNVILEIRGAEGGEEANLWAAELARMYEALARRHGWRFETLSTQPSEMGGQRDVTLAVKGPDAWARLKHEAGPHRVQRVPVTESQGRVHTSAATVAVLPEAEEVDVEIDPNDLTIDVYRSSGPGGQSVNTTDSAVRMTHVPTGIVVTCQDEKSQLQNKDKALRILRSRLLQLERDRQETELSSTRRDQVKGGGRSEKVRTYNFKENRVTDHRVGVTVHALDQAGGGGLQPISQAILVESFSQKRQGMAMAVYGMGVVVAPIIGPTLGGWITDSFSWRWIFFINVPVGVAAILMTLALVHDPPYLVRKTTSRG